MAYWILDAGHGGVDSGAIGRNGLHEADVNLQLALKVREILINKGERVDMIRTTDTTVDLSARPSFANAHKCDCFVSFHNNSSDNTSVSGTEVHVQNLGGKAETLGKYILNELAQVISPNRGLKISNLCVNRESNMPSCLIEADFISNVNVEAQMRTQEWIDKVATAIAKGCLKMVGKDYQSQPTPQPKPVQPQPVVKHPIMGQPQLTKEQIVKYILDNNKNPQISIALDEFIQIYFEEGQVEGVRGDLAACQSILETGFFKFGNDVKPEQCNYAGIAATGSVQGASFPSPREGVQAQVQHLKGYASKEPLKRDKVDPRFDLLQRGVAPNLEDLNGKWSVQSDYADKILTIYNKIKAIPVDKPEQKMGVVQGSNAIIIGDRLYARDEQGNRIDGYADINDKIKVIDVSYSKQLALIEYPIINGTKQAYVTNCDCIKYDKDSAIKVPYRDVFDIFNGEKIGSINNGEYVTILEEYSDGYNVAYSTDKGKNSKSGKVFKWWN